MGSRREKIRERHIKIITDDLFATTSLLHHLASTRKKLQDDVTFEGTLLIDCVFNTTLY
jgi:hypothetical protein